MKTKEEEPAFIKGWRPIAAYVYLLICLCDFMFMPVYYEYANHKNQRSEYVKLALEFKEPVAQMEALKTITQTRVWDPVTLKMTGLFHMSFGAILGVAAWTRGKEKIAAIENSAPTVSAGPAPRPKKKDEE